MDRLIASLAPRGRRAAVQPGGKRGERVPPQLRNLGIGHGRNRIGGLFAAPLEFGEVRGGVGLGVRVDDVVVRRAEEQQVVESVPLGGSLHQVVARTVRPARLDVADPARDFAAGGINQRLATVRKGAAVPGQGEQALLRRATRSGGAHDQF